jgi:hypothetical protein
MKAGDIVLLKALNPKMSSVSVSWETPPLEDGWDEGLPEISNEKWYPTGTPAMFIRVGTRQPRPSGATWSVVWILVEGRLGWVWDEEIEPVEGSSQEKQ